MKHITIFAALFTAVALIFSFCSIFIQDTGVYSPSSINTLPVVVIDAGHGGEDGGASAYGDIPEKTINLEISTALCDMLRFFGVKTIMTRTDDRLLYDINSDYHGHKKSQDLKKRLEITENAGGAILVSIHMNAFPESQYKGLQVYYSPHSEDSYRLASMVQEKSRTALMPENSRKVKKADSGIYLLDRYKDTGILIECGFLSNPEEYEILCTKSYQKELSAAFLSCLLKYIESGGI